MPLKFPDPFALIYPKQSRIIQDLMDREPAARSSAQTILNSDLMPPKPEDEYMSDAIRSLSDRNSAFHQRAVETCESNTSRLHVADCCGG